MVKSQRKLKEKGQISTKDILYDLLQKQQQRLEISIKGEQERNMVFPETSVIIDSIKSISELLNAKENKNKETSRYY